MKGKKFLSGRWRKASKRGEREECEGGERKRERVYLLFLGYASRR
jgi:hypothetical protein